MVNKVFIYASNMNTTREKNDVKKGRYICKNIS